MTRARVAKRASESEAVVVANQDLAAITSSQQFMDRIAVEVFRGVVAAIQGAFRGELTDVAQTPKPEPSDVMNADEAAAFLGVDRTTVYNFAGRGVIPHQRLGKRLLFRRGALVAWLDASLASSLRKP